MLAVVRSANNAVIFYDLHRSWRCEAMSERYLFVSASVPRSQSSSSSSSSSSSLASSSAADDSDVDAQLIAGHYVIEPCGTDKSRLIHFSSIDFR